MDERNIQIVTDMCNALTGGNMAALVEYLTDDVYYYNVPWEPVHGRAAVRAVLDPFVHGENCAVQKMVIHHSAANGAIVMNARTETWSRNDVTHELEVAGLFTLRDGLIARWTDYWDLVGFQPFIDAASGAS
jgi:limonene-1,2-epoxide hydrolase